MKALTVKSIRSLCDGIQAVLRTGSRAGDGGQRRGKWERYHWRSLPTKPGTICSVAEVTRSQGRGSACDPFEIARASPAAVST